MFSTVDTNPTIDALARCRQTVLARASQVLDSESLQAGPHRPENFPIDDSTRQWPLVLRRVGDVPVAVRATVRRVPDLGATRSGVLHWVVFEPQPAGLEAQP